MTSASDHDLHTALDTLQSLEGTLIEARAHAGDPVALAPIMGRLVGLVNVALPDLSGLPMGPEEKAVMLRLQAQIAELERYLHVREGVLGGFSLHLKEMVEGRGR